MLQFNATFLIAMFSFVVFIIIMNAIFYKPVLSIMKKREDYILNNSKNAKEFSEKATELDKDKEDQILSTQQDCRQDVKTQIEQTKKSANEKISDARKNAQVELKSLKENLHNSANEVSKVVNDNILNDLASTISDKLIG